MLQVITIQPYSILAATVPYTPVAYVPGTTVFGPIFHPPSRPADPVAIPQPQLPIP